MRLWLRTRRSGVRITPGAPLNPNEIEVFEKTAATAGPYLLQRDPPHNLPLRLSWPGGCGVALVPACSDRLHRVTMDLRSSSMQKEYVRKIEGAYRVGETRVSLDSLIYLFREGMSAEGMVDSYPALTLEEVHGALAFYLGNQKEIDCYLAAGQRTADSEHRQSRQTNAELIAKLQRARHASQIPG
jgi:uncharacterized protein (DUF433 family)